MTATSISLRLEALEEQSMMRHRLSALLAEHARPDRLRDAVLLVTTELFTNAIEHAAARAVHVDVLVAREVTVTVRHRSPEAPPSPADATMPPPKHERGRGLAIVHRLSDQVATESVDGWQSTTAVLTVVD